MSGHDRGIVSVMWHVTLKYMGALIGRQCHGHCHLPRSCRRHARDMTGTNPSAKIARRSDRGFASENVHARSRMYCHGDFSKNRIATSFEANSTRDTPRPVSVRFSVFTMADKRSVDILRLITLVKEKRLMGCHCR